LRHRAKPITVQITLIFSRNDSYYDNFQNPKLSSQIAEIKTAEKSRGERGIPVWHSGFGAEV
jgi:hypothetical protein